MAHLCTSFSLLIRSFTLCDIIFRVMILRVCFSLFQLLSLTTNWYLPLTLVYSTNKFPFFYIKLIDKCIHQSDCIISNHLIFSSSVICLIADFPCINCIPYIHKNHTIFTLFTFCVYLTNIMGIFTN